MKTPASSSRDEQLLQNIHTFVQLNKERIHLENKIHDDIDTLSNAEHDDFSENLRAKQDELFDKLIQLPLISQVGLGYQLDTRNGDSSFHIERDLSRKLIEPCKARYLFVCLSRHNALKDNKSSNTSLNIFIQLISTCLYNNFLGSNFNYARDTYTDEFLDFYSTLGAAEKYFIEHRESASNQILELLSYRNSSIMLEYKHMINTHGYLDLLHNTDRTKYLFPDKHGRYISQADCNDAWNKIYALFKFYNSIIMNPRTSSQKKQELTAFRDRLIRDYLDKIEYLLSSQYERPDDIDSSDKSNRINHFQWVRNFLLALQHQTFA